jgi:uncharacterized protein (TIGR00369 family)
MTLTNESEPLSAARIAAIHDSFRRQGLMSTLGARLSVLSRGESTIHVPLSDRVTQQHGFFHGGVIGAIADTACGYAALSIVPEGKAGLTAEYKINLISPADGEVLVVQGRVLKPGRTLIVCQADAFIEKSGVRKLCAVALMTLCVVDTLSAI